ncbi:MAG: hypothetical protein JWN93_2498 [Hyphomicrobiales bacterium]|nr:hypothetical protein [Hyphomicrobiales bacterium]
MSLQNHLAELERRHEALQREIDQTKRHPSTDPVKVAELKRKKLLLKDEITKLKAPAATVH